MQMILVTYDCYSYPHKMTASIKVGSEVFGTTVIWTQEQAIQEQIRGIFSKSNDIERYYTHIAQCVEKEHIKRGTTVLEMAQNIKEQWLTKDVEVKTELDRRLQAITQNANMHLRSQTDKLMDSMLDLALDSSTEARTRNSALQYLLDRSLGRATEQINIDLQESTDSADVLQSFKDFLENNGYPKFEGREDNV